MMLIFPSHSLGVKLFSDLLQASPNSHSTHKSWVAWNGSFSDLAIEVVLAFPSPVLQQPEVTTKQERLQLIWQSRVLPIISQCSSLCTMLAIEHHNCTTWDVSYLTSLTCIPFSTQTSLSVLFSSLFPYSVVITSINNCASTPVTPRGIFYGFSLYPCMILLPRSWYASTIHSTILSWTNPPQALLKKVPQKRS